MKETEITTPKQRKEKKEEQISPTQDEHREPSNTHSDPQSPIHVSDSEYYEKESVVEEAKNTKKENPKTEMNKTKKKHQPNTEEEDQNEEEQKDQNTTQRENSISNPHQDIPSRLKRNMR